MAKNGGAASIFTHQGASVLASGEAMTRIGTTSEYYINNRASANDKSWWDPAHVPIIKDGGAAIDPIHILEIDYAAGMVTLDAAAVGAVTADVYYFVPEWLGGAYGFDIQPKTDKKEVTCFTKTLNTVRKWRKYIATLKDWTASIDRHYWFGCGRTIMDCTAENADLVWVWKSYGALGNAEKVKYEEGGALEITRVGHVTTITFVADTTTAAQVKAHVLADPAIAALWDVSYSGAQTGVGKINTKAEQTCTGGRDHSSDIARLGTDILVRFYLDVQDASLEILSGVGMVESVPLDVKLEDTLDAPLTLQGNTRLKYHTV